MKKNILTNMKNVVNRTFMVKKQYTKVLCIVVMLLGMSVSAWGYTATFHTGMCNTGVDPVAESSNGDGIEFPDGVTPTAAGWEFVGWAEASCTETTTAPELLLPGDEKTLYSNKDYYAVYRKYTTGTSTATFAANDDGTNIVESTLWLDDWREKSSGIELWIESGQRYTTKTPYTWSINKSDGDWHYASISAYRKIKKIDVTLSGTDFKIDDGGDGVYSDNDTYSGDTRTAAAASVSTDGLSQTVTCEGLVFGDVTKVLLYATESYQIRMTTFTVTYYNAKFSSNPSDTEVALTKGTQTNATISSFSPSDVPTCSSTAADRNVTITVEAATGYEFLSTARLTYSGDGTASYVSGPTGSGPYTFVYRFAKDDDGDGTFSVTSATAKTYTINLNGNTGTDHTSSVTATYNSSTLSSSITNPSKTGHTFKGWYSGSGGTGSKIIDENGALQASVDGYTGAGGIWTKDGGTTLYAKWEVNHHTLAVSAVDNVEISSTSPEVAENASESVDYGTTVTLSHGEADEGHVWGGWNVYKSDDENTIVSVNGSNQFTMPDYNVTVSANLYGDLKAWCETMFGIYDQAGTGDADIHLTSTYNVSVYTTYERENLITIIAENLDAIANLGGGTTNKQNIQIKYLDANNSDAEVDKTKSPFRLCYYNEEGKTNYNVADGSNINLNGLVDYSQTYAISYTPKDYGVTDHYKLQLKLQNNTTEAKTITLDLYGRSLPREFVIAAKYVDPSDDTNNGKWFALPNTIISNSSLITPIEITVDNATEPTKAIGSPSTVLYRAMNRYAPGTNRYAISFTDNDVPAYASRNKLKISKNSNYVYLGTGGSTIYQDWYLESSDFGAYTVTMPSDDSDASGKSMGLWSYSGIKMGYYSNPPKGADIFFLPVDYGDVEANIMEWGTDHLVMELRDKGDVDYVKTQIAVGDLGSKQTLSSIKKDEGVYYLSQTLSTSNAGQDLKIYFYDDEDALLGVEAFTIPMLISASDATTLDISAATAGLCDLVVLNGGVLTVSETTSGAKKTFRDLYIYGGGKMVVPEDTYIDFSNVYMRGGHLNASWQYQYSNPQLVLNGTMGNASDTINYDYLTNNAQFYSLALPYPVKLKDIVNPYFNNKRSWEIHAYNGRARSTGGSGWYDVETGTGVYPNRIDGLGAENALSVGVGYTFWGAMQKVNSVRQLWSVNRFKMPLASGTAEAEKFEEEDDGVDVKAYGMSYNADSAKYVYDENIRKNNAGWNMVGNPFLADIVGSDGLESSLTGIIIDIHEEKVLDDKGKWNGQTKWVKNESGARYVRVPYDNGEDYNQVRFNDTTLRAFHHFFIQVAVNGKFRIAKTHRAQSMPARVRANGAVLPTEMDIDFILRSESDKSSFGLTVNDAFVPAFKVGEDMPDELGGVNIKAYTLANGERLSYNGLPSDAAEQTIPVGYRAQTAGTHTFSHKPGRYDDYIEHIWLTDYVTGQTVDLLNGAYEFTTETGVFDGRFALNVVFDRNHVPTDFEEVETYDTDEQPTKFIHNDKMFIRHRNVLYDATGKKVGEVRKAQ